MLKREMHKLKHEAGFIIADPLFQKILADAGE
jgi:hypothetical protein